MAVCRDCGRTAPLVKRRCLACRQRRREWEAHVAVVSRETMAAFRARVAAVRRPLSQVPVVASRRTLLAQYPFPRKVSVATRPWLLADPCVYCYGPASTLDHIVPASQGGPGWWGNLAPACLRCNGSKADQPLLLWLVGQRLEV